MTEKEKHERTVREFWRLFDEARYEDVAPLLRPDCRIYWPNTRELFRGSQKLIAVNRNYPGRWYIEVIEVVPEGERVISVVRVYSKEVPERFYAVSFFTFSQGLVSEIVEYWGNITEAPAWRLAQGYSELY